MGIFRAIGRFFRHCRVVFARTVLILLVYLLYDPKVYFVDKRVMRLRRLRRSAVLTCNHLRGCDGAVILGLLARSLAARSHMIKPVGVGAFDAPCVGYTLWRAHLISRRAV